jgi:hypothetical protein
VATVATPLVKAIESLHDVLDLAWQLSRTWGGRVWWRGQPVSKPLTPGIFRLDLTKYPQGWEQNLTLQFMSRAPARHAHCPAHLDYAAWLFFMQHYRLRTRLLDWTESVLFATFFAVEEALGETGELWALNTAELNQNQLGTTFLSIPEDPRVEPMFRAAFVPQAYSGKIVAVGVREVDVRVMVQQSAFTLHDTPQSLEQLPNPGNFLSRFEIPATAKDGIRAHLLTVGVERRHLFPDLETLAKALMGEE